MWFLKTLYSRKKKRKDQSPQEKKGAEGLLPKEQVVRFKCKPRGGGEISSESPKIYFVSRRNARNPKISEEGGTHPFFRKETAFGQRSHPCEVWRLESGKETAPSIEETIWEMQAGRNGEGMQKRKGGGMSLPRIGQGEVSMTDRGIRWRRILNQRAIGWGGKKLEQREGNAEKRRKKNLHHSENRSNTSWSQKKEGIEPKGEENN